MMAINNQRLKVVSQSFQKYTEREGNIVRGTLEVKKLSLNSSANSETLGSCVTIINLFIYLSYTVG